MAQALTLQSILDIDEKRKHFAAKTFYSVL